MQEVDSIYDMFLNLGKWENWNGEALVSNKKRVTNFHVRKNDQN
jgi:hypothetical protein